MFRTALTRRFFLGLAGAALLAAPLASLAATAASADDVVVFAAASLKNALDDVAAAYKAKTGKTVVISYAASSALAKQIEQKAPADIFFSADLDWMNYLQDRDLIQKDTRSTLLGNKIVLVAPKDSTASITIGPDMKLAALLGADGRLAMANVNSVPAGKYGKAALEKLGVWSSVADHIVQADNVRAALAFVARNEAPVGIVYETDANAEAGGQGDWRLPRRQSPADPLPGRHHRRVDQSRHQGLLRFHAVGGRQGCLREAGLHLPGAGVVNGRKAT